MSDTIYIGQGEEAVQRFIGQRVWLASGSPALTITEINEAKTAVIVEWLDDNFNECFQAIPAACLRAYDTNIGRVI